VTWPGASEDITAEDGSYLVTSLCDATYVLAEVGNQRGFVVVEGDPSVQRYDIVLVGP
jgi:hypothetical protein